MNIIFTTWLVSLRAKDYRCQDLSYQAHPHHFPSLLMSRVCTAIAWCQQVVLDIPFSNLFAKCRSKRPELSSPPKKTSFDVANPFKLYKYHLSYLWGANHGTFQPWSPPIQSDPPMDPAKIHVKNSHLLQHSAVQVAGNADRVPNSWQEKSGHLNCIFAKKQIQ